MRKEISNWLIYNFVSNTSSEREGPNFANVNHHIYKSYSSCVCSKQKKGYAQKVLADIISVGDIRTALNIPERQKTNYMRIYSKSRHLGHTCEKILFR